VFDRNSPYALRNIGWYTIGFQDHQKNNDYLKLKTINYGAGIRCQ